MTENARRRQRIVGRIVLVLLLLVLAISAWIYWPERVDLSDLADAGDPYDARILRDSWGVPHIFGITDADAAYGLAYAHAEDDFLTIQQSLLAARGLLATVYGREAAANDYMVHLLRIWDGVEASYDSALMPDTRTLVEAYAAGLNHYAALHEDEVLTAALFPLTGKDIVAASVHKSPLFFGLDETLGELFAEERQREVSLRRELSGQPSQPAQPAAGQAGETCFASCLAGIPLVETYGGSNTFSVGPSRTADGSTFLAVNSHQPWTGPVAWYEAHVHSEEGWDMTGALFPASPVIIHGHNRDLGWAFTVNHPDLTDVYVLDVDPENPNRYRFDGEWLELAVEEVTLSVRLVGRLRLPIRQEVLWSVYGPAVRQPHGVYALRYANFGRIDIWQQLYRMNKATNFEEWQAAMADGGLASFNVGYADKAGNIYYLYNAALPIRNENYDWSLYLPGDTSETLWTSNLPFADLPQVLNPPAGFVQNANSSPFQTTVGEGNPDPDAYSPALGIETTMTNRAWRALALFEADPSLTFDEFTAIKYDMTYDSRSGMAEYLRQLFAGPIPTDPTLQAAVDLLRGWDRQARPNSREAALAVLFITYLAENNPDVKASSLDGVPLGQEALLAALEQAVQTLQDHYGRLDPPWSEVNRLVRGEVSLGLGGGPDLLHAIYGKVSQDGRLVAKSGDSFIQLVRWKPGGAVESFSIHQFGSASLDETSPHYADQAALFAERRLKPVWFDEADIRANLEREYRPGEE